MDITEIYTPETSETGKTPLKYCEIMLALFSLICFHFLCLVAKALTEEETEPGACTYTALDFNSTSGRSTAGFAGRVSHSRPECVSSSWHPRASVNISATSEHSSVAAAPPPRAAVPRVPLQTPPDNTTCQLSAGTQQAASRGFYIKSLLILFC